MRNVTLATGWAALTLTATAISGCGPPSPHPHSATSTPSAGASTAKTAASSNYSHLLISADAVDDGAYTAQPPELNPRGIPGAARVFVNQAGTRAIGDTVFVLDTAQAAAASLNSARQALGTVVDDVVGQPAPVGANGVLAAGQAPHAAKAVTVVMFTEGRTFTTLKFDAATNDAVPAAEAIQIAQRQDAQIKTTPL